MLESKLFMFTETFVLTDNKNFQCTVIRLDKVENSSDVSHFDIDLVYISFMPYIKSNITGIMSNNHFLNLLKYKMKHLKYYSRDEILE